MFDKNNLPQLGDDLPAVHPSQETLSLLRLRRSTSVKNIIAPGPNKNQLEELLYIASRVPDHRRVVPYRFVIFQGKAREEFGKILGHAWQKANPGASREEIELEEGRFLRVPLIVAVIASPDKDHKTPEWEQTLTCGAVCQNLTVGANAMGFAAQWLTEWYAYDKNVHRALGMSEYEAVAGFIYLGTAAENPKERPRINPEEITRFWTSD